MGGEGVGGGWGRGVAERHTQSAKSPSTATVLRELGGEATPK